MINLVDMTDKKIILTPFALDTVLMYHKLKQEGLSPVCFFDNNPQLWGKKYVGVPILKPHYIKDAIVILSKVHNIALRELLLDKWHYAKEELFDCSEVTTSCDDVSASAYVDCAAYKHYSPVNAMLYTEKVYDNEIFALGGGYLRGQLAELKRLRLMNSMPPSERKSALVLHHASVSVTTKCSLQCRWCCQGLQYMPKRSDFNIDDVLCGIDNFFSGVDYICEFGIIGGEPLIYKDLDKVIQHFLDSDVLQRKIGTLKIITNGTITPSESLLRLLSKLDSILQISNYGDLSEKMHDIVLKAAEHNIFSTPIPKQTWLACNVPLEYEMQNERLDAERAKKQYSLCRGFNSPCFMLYGRAVYPCGSLYAFEKSNIVPVDEQNSLSLENPLTREAVIELGNRCLSACKWCSTNFCESWDNYDTDNYIPVAEQSKWPVEGIKKYGL